MTPTNTGNGDAMAFNFPAVSNHVSRHSVGISQPFSSATNGYHATHQEPMQTSPIPVSQVPTSMGSPAGLISPKRVADSVNGMYGNQRRGSSKRQRLDLTIKTELSNSGASQYSHQPSHFRAATPQGSSAMRSIDRGSIDVPMSASSLDRSRSSSTAVPGYMPMMQAPWMSQPQSSNYAHNQGYGGPSSVFNIPAGYDSQRSGAFPIPTQSMPSASMRYESRFPSASGMNGLVYGAGERMNSCYPIRQTLDSTLVKPKQTSDGRFVLVVKQQPERARLCSFKEENDTSKPFVIQALWRH